MLRAVAFSPRVLNFWQLLAVLPSGLLLDAISVDHDAVAVVLAFAPLPLVRFSIRPHKGALAMPQVPLVAACVVRAIGPDHDAFALHVAMLPLPGVLPAIRKIIDALSMHLVVFEPATEHHIARIGCVLPHPVLAAVEKCTFVLGAIGPPLNTSSALLVLIPFALVNAPVLECVDATSMRPILFPLALVHVATRSYELPNAMSPAV
mmetsp:Transcript_46700/g.130000  ORF Transcript_46700/g.130000 Transcript_46700/m.130000 type:complete len:206 (-) Transcript_46700:387-1004(-)